MPNTCFATLIDTANQIGLAITPLPTQADTAQIRSWLHHLNQSLHSHLSALGLAATNCIKQTIDIRTQAIDAILVQLYHQHQLPNTCALLAVGGYGRGELLPASDVDILLIGQDIDQHQSSIEAFVAALWDIGITPAIAVRNPDDTTLAIKDHTVATALLESRHLTGDVRWLDFCQQAINTHWQLANFCRVKLDESKARYVLYNATEYNLEPNIKNAPGGLRDIHIIGWLAKFLDIDKQTDFIHADEAATLQNAQAFLWLLRHHLHTITARGEDRLLFDHQKSLVATLGLCQQMHDHHALTAALETLMREYYRHAMQVAALSELLCDYIKQNYLPSNPIITRIDEDFCQINDTDGQYIATYQTDIFFKKPHYLLQIFLIMGKLGIKKIHAKTLRAIGHACHLIDVNYRNNPQHQQLFLANLQENNYLFHRLRLMKRCGVLGGYLPAFTKITGLMQYDLFHRYTVDAHTLLLIRVLHRFLDDAYADKYDLVSQVYQSIQRKDILAIAAVFHDIAKGRNGDHSQLGAVDAALFCQSHGMNDEDTNFITWLVQEHLTMSLTAQKKDISDPQIIADFAEFCGSITRLNYLYVLTVADMNATNSQLWNSWRASLLKQLYINTHRALSLGLATLNQATVIKDRQDKAKELLPNISNDTLDTLWQSFDDEYFFKQKPADIAWQADELLAHQDTLQTGTPIIALRRHTDLSLGGIQLLICSPDQENLFASTVCALDKLGLSVLDASIFTATLNGISTALDSYVLIDRLTNTHQPALLDDPHRQQQLITQLMDALRHQTCQVPSVFTTASFKHFAIPTQVHFSIVTTLAYQGLHQMQLITKDRPSLLARLGLIFQTMHIEVHGARITTLGERAEDIFYLSGKQGKTLDEDTLAQLKNQIIATLA